MRLFIWYDITKMWYCQLSWWCWSNINFDEPHQHGKIRSWFESSTRLTQKILASLFLTSYFPKTFTYMHAYCWWSFSVIVGTVYLSAPQWQMDLMEFLGGVSPPVQEASSVLTNQWGVAGFKLRWNFSKKHKQVQYSPCSTEILHVYSLILTVSVQPLCICQLTYFLHCIVH